MSAELPASTQLDIVSNIYRVHSSAFHIISNLKIKYFLNHYWVILFFQFYFKFAFSFLDILTHCMYYFRYIYIVECWKIWQATSGSATLLPSIDTSTIKLVAVVVVVGSTIVCCLYPFYFILLIFFFRSLNILASSIKFYCRPLLLSLVIYLLLHIFSTVWG